MSRSRMMSIAGSVTLLLTSCGQANGVSIERAYAEDPVPRPCDIRSFQRLDPAPWTESSPAPRLAFSDGSTICVVDLDGSTSIAVVPEPVFGTEPAWSPDGTQLAFQLWHSGTTELIVADGDGRNPRSLTIIDWGGEVRPDWSPDGSRIAFQQRAGIYAINPDGTELEQLTSQFLDGAPSWSPDGTRIALERCVRTESGGGCTSERNIWIIDADGSNPTQLTFGGQGTNPAWSPHGDVIAFESFGDVTIVSATDGSPRVLIPGTQQPAWSPDGTMIAVLTQIGTRLDRDGLWIFDADGSNPRFVLPAAWRFETMLGWSAPSWGPPAGSVSVPVTPGSTRVGTSTPGAGTTTLGGSVLADPTCEAYLRITYYEFWADFVIARLEQAWSSQSVDERRDSLSREGGNLLDYGRAEQDLRTEVLSDGALDPEIRGQLGVLAEFYAGLFAGFGTQYGEVSTVDTVLEAASPPELDADAVFGELDSVVSALDVGVINDIAAGCGRDPWLDED